MAVRALIVVLILAGAGIYARALEDHHARVATLPDLARLPRQIDGWVGEDYSLTDPVAAVLGADTVLFRLYRRPEDGASVWLFLAYFKQQAVNSQIHSPRNCVPGSGWTVQSVKPVHLELGGAGQDARRMVIEKNGQEQEMLYWFRTRGGDLSGEYRLKWDLVLNSLRGRPTDAAFIRYNASERDRDALREFMTSMRQPLNGVLGQVGL